MVPVQTGSEMVSGNMGMPRPETKWSGVFRKIPDLDRDRGVWSGPDRVPIGLGLNFPNTSGDSERCSKFLHGHGDGHLGGCQVAVNWLNSSLMIFTRVSS